MSDQQFPERPRIRPGVFLICYLVGMLVLTSSVRILFPEVHIVFLTVLSTLAAALYPRIARSVGITDPWGGKDDQA
ncbi:hypothetical protein D9V32_00590 [Mycetocola tolaasinivorans]|uniref:Uncharacterized protein n=1 Tax=Mycetocola tolaasinivorans TaxID=76635 RepID=A0A3L7ACB9_9MICO|nr:hypothetical protein [Mycetocola tolaasinivorans]RLP77867.1 hypothetical protein D9V32_00590 [Mycetocola tolaasinivorans]